MPLVLTQEIKDLVNNGLASGNPLLLAVVTQENKPALSFRGSTQVYSDDQLGLWIRNTAGGTIEAIRRNPHVAMMYRSATTPLLQFQGRARIATDETERKRVFEKSPEREQKSDPERKGNAIVIDLDKVEGVLRFGADGPVFAKLAR
jgi:Pyridoxamine 5'-phosphate oxidase